MKYSISLLVIWLLLFSGSSFAKEKIYFEKTATINELALKNNIKTSKLIHELEDEMGFESVVGTSIVQDVGVSRDQFEKLYLHLNESLSPLILTGMAIWVLIGVFVIILLRKNRLSSVKRIVIFAFVILFFGVLLHARPSPMEAMVKLFKATAGKETWHLKVLLFSFFSIFSIAASNLFCSVGCQVGVFQDLLFQLFRLKKIKSRKLPFWITNGVRAILLVLFVLFMYDVLTGLKVGSLYHHVNIFKVYISNLGTIGGITFVTTVLLSGFIYRPFCSLICPFGFWSWAISHLSIMKIRIRQADCTKCQKCVKVCPNNSMDSIYNEKIIKSDCYVCGECIAQCPANCIDFKI